MTWAVKIDYEAKAKKLEKELAIQRGVVRVLNEEVVRLSDENDHLRRNPFNPGSFQIYAVGSTRLEPLSIRSMVPNGYGNLDVFVDLPQAPQSFYQPAYMSGGRLSDGTCASLSNYANRIYPSERVYDKICFDGLAWGEEKPPT